MLGVVMNTGDGALNNTNNPHSYGAYILTEQRQEIQADI